MGRVAEPRFRKDRGTWCAWVGGKKVTLAKGKASKAEAYRVFHALMAVEGEGRPGAEPIGVRVLVNQFLGHCDRELSPASLAWYTRHLKTFSARYATRPAADIRPLDVTNWLAAHDWAAGTRRGAITAVKRMTAWGRRQKFLDADPLADMERPAASKRKKIMTADQFATILAAVADREFRDFLSVLWETGARPGELMGMEARHVRPDAPFAVMEAHKTARKTGEDRVIPLAGEAEAIVRRLCAEHPTGPIFRNRKGTPWTRHIVAHRFGRLRRKLGMGKEATAYAIRHRFATDLSKSGVPDITAAAILGHKGTAMIQTYSHVEKDHAHLLDVANRVRRSGTDPPPSPGDSGPPPATP